MTGPSVRGASDNAGGGAMKLERYGDSFFGGAILFSIPMLVATGS